MSRYNELEDGEVLDVRLYDDMGFYKFLHVNFKKHHVVAESKYIFSFNL
jgi:hypothetical protein